MREDFCAVIFSHDRAGDVKTINALNNSGYTGDWFIVVDHMDDKEVYEEEYGEDKVVYFDKEEVVDEIDRGDNFEIKGGLIYGRNKVFDLVEELGYKYFIQLDDDYTGFSWRFNKDFNYEYNKVENLDSLFEELVSFMERSGCDSVAISQGGDFIGGEESYMAEKVRVKRKAMNTWVCSVDREFPYMGSMNDDVNAYVRNQQLGKLFFTVNVASINQPSTQSEEGGMTDIYLDTGTYVKSFYTLLYSPSSVSLTKIGNKNMRIHHNISWRNTVPKIVPEDVKKGDDLK